MTPRRRWEGLIWAESRGKEPSADAPHRTGAKAELGIFLSPAFGAGLGGATVGLVSDMAAPESHSVRTSRPEVVLGIDPGTRVVGYGAVARRGSQCALLAAGVIRAGGSSEIATRLGHIRQSLDELLRKLNPQVVVVEKAFAHQNIASALRIGEGRGVALACASTHGALVHEFTPAEVKKALTGNGSADKSIVARCVALELGSEEGMHKLRHDATDGLALALTWVRRQHLQSLGL